MFQQSASKPSMLLPLWGMDFKNSTVGWFLAILFSAERVLSGSYLLGIWDVIRKKPWWTLLAVDYSWMIDERLAILERTALAWGIECIIQTIYFPTNNKRKASTSEFSLVRRIVLGKIHIPDSGCVFLATAVAVCRVSVASGDDNRQVYCQHPPSFSRITV